MKTIKYFKLNLSPPTQRSTFENMNSSIIPSVIKYLEEDCLLLPKRNYVIEGRTLSLSLLEGETFEGLAVTVYFRAEHNSYNICGWGEQFEGKEGIFYHQKGLIPKDEAVKLIIETLSSSSWIEDHLDSPLFLEKKKNKEFRQENDLLRKKIERLDQEVERLRQKKRELKYAPRNRGALKAQQHFENILQ
nr:ATP-dependent Zn protease [Marseillevirus cajuinensis]